MDQSVDLVLTVSVVTTLLEVEDLLVPSTVRGRQLEGGQELVDVLELVTAGVELVDHVLNADNTVLSDGVLDHGVVGDGLPLLVDVDVPSLVNKLFDGLEVGVTVSNVGLNQTEHLDGGLVQTDEHTVVDLPQAEELEDLPGLGVNTVDTTDTDDERNLGLGLPVEVTSLLGLAAEGDLRPLHLAVLGDVFLGALEVLLLGGGVLGLELGHTSGALGLDGLEALALLQGAFGDGGVLGVAIKRKKKLEKEK